MGRIKCEIWTTEQIDTYLKDKYPTKSGKSEQEIDIQKRKQREAEVDAAVEKIINIIEGKEEGD